MRRVFYIFLTILIFFLLVLFSFNIIRSQPTEGLENLEETKGKIETYTDQNYWNQKWDYLGGAWKEILLRNPIISFLDNFFSRISFLFLILFGVPYELSLVLFLSIFLWLFTWGILHDILKSTGVFNGKVEIFVSLFSVIALAQIRIFINIVVFVGNFVFSPESKWARVILIAGLFGCFVLIKYISSFVSKYVKAKREADEKKLEKLNRTILSKVVKAMMDFSK